ncbi:hypothetical protein NP493_575g01001 [Ridgeia piscesae]|uniref:Uncharacterized protein n=1 Tax=Ridgeia piscesae TaxID=27915 RepID=A0AAD9KV35_RIDPI|nr:hypothetical protein NP493_575g01001 [Ridgeia piscesae]
MALLSAMIKIASQRHNNDVFDKKTEDPTQLITTFRATDLVGIISFLYGILLHSGAPTKGDNTPPPELSTQTLTVTVMGFKMFNHLTVLSLELMQVSAGRW